MKKLTILAAVVALGISLAFAGTTITVKGSDTLVRLGQRWAEVYMQKHPGVTIQVSGGGSGTGIA
ncbi:MAG: phosphate ABC transporter substrate-binding protein, partial [Candidatus Zixiibacteriota bacterium]